jgi:phosphoribosylanthranilate isomerase
MKQKTENQTTNTARIIVKICGLRSVEQATHAAAAGADLLGVVFAPSRRQTTPEQVAAIATALCQHPQGQRVGLVGLFVNETPAQINAIADYCGLDYVQLSGDEPPDHATQIARPIIRALRLTGTAEETAWLALAEPRQRPEGTFAPCPFVIDANVSGAYGGTGTPADWEKAAALAATQPVLLAGGLCPANVAEAIAQVRPRGVDVSSGVETDGTKDPARVEAFIRLARAAATEHTVATNK